MFLRLSNKPVCTLVQRGRRNDVRLPPIAAAGELGLIDEWAASPIWRKRALI